MEIEKFLIESCEEAEELEEPGELKKEPAGVFEDPPIDYTPKGEDEDGFIGTPREKLQWVRDDYTPFEQSMWESYDGWCVMHNNHTLSFNKWLKQKCPNHVSPGYIRSCEAMPKARELPK